MMEEKDNYHDEEMIDAVNRFRRSLISGRTRYFDVSEFEGIVEQLLEEGDLKTSEIAAKQAIRMHPNAIPLQLKYAQILINKGHYQKALKYLIAAEKTDHNNPDVHLLKGSAKLITGHEKDAVASFRKAVQHAGSDLDEIYYQIGSAYIQIGNIKKGIRYFEKTVLLNPEHDLALYDLGYFYDHEENHTKSIKYYNLYLDIDPYNQYVWFNLGTVYNKIENHEKAIEAYEFAYAINSDFHMALFNIGNAQANAGHFEKAIDTYHEFLALEPENDEAYCYLGECFLNTEDYTQSFLNYNRSIELNKKNDSAWFGIGLILWIEQKYQESIGYIEEAIRLDEHNAEYWLTLGKVQKDSGNIAAAFETIKKASRVEPANTEVWLTWADVYLFQDDFENALITLRKGISKNNDPILKYKLVAILLQKRKTQEAIATLKKALEQDFIQINFLYDIYPRAMNNKKVIRVLTDFLASNGLEFPEKSDRG